jgi:1-acyl-sn-glycerol-3-phosphate acyltransferase
MERFKTGIGSLAVEFPDLPIVPVALIGLERILPKPSPLPVPMSCTVRVLPATTGKELTERLGTESRKDVAAELERILRDALAKAEDADSELRLRR